MKLTFFMVVALVGALGVTSARGAGRHYCSNMKGEIVVSDTPCQSSDPSTTQSATKVLTDQPRADGAPFTDAEKLRDQHVPYMSSRCRYLYETLMSMRNSRWASVTYEQRRNAENNYRAECGDEEMEARTRLSKELRDKRRTLADESKQQQEAELQRSKNEARMREQCIESRRIIVERRARTNLTPGELQDLARFEDNVKQRCQPGHMEQ